RKRRAKFNSEDPPKDNVEEGNDDNEEFGDDDNEVEDSCEKGKSADESGYKESA
ncbi:hypothetical protein HAX54_030138, partial [Datura stramonium]|nr:hypothetical protein [Datura stramonium]